MAEINDNVERLCSLATESAKAADEAYIKYCRQRDGVPEWLEYRRLKDIADTASDNAWDAVRKDAKRKTQELINE